MSRVVVDTNVPIVANGRSDPNGERVPSLACRIACIERLKLILQSGKVLLDLAGEIQAEYRTHLNPRGQPGVGDRFYQEVLNSAPARIERVELPKRGDGEFVDVPQALIDANFDPSDRKFAALSRRERVPVVNATDSDWLVHRETLEREGVKVELLCGCDRSRWFACSSIRPMLPALSLRLRLTLLLGAVLAAGLAIGVGLLILHAGARVRAEADAATRLARELVEASLARIDASGAGEGELERLLADARKLRHVRVFIEGDAPPPRENGDAKRPPAWFAALAQPRDGVVRIAAGPGRTLVVAADPADEITEIWEEVVWLALGGFCVAAAAFALMWFAVSRTLRPVSALAAGLARLEAGDHAARVPSRGPPDLAVIAERINALAAALERLDDENGRLLRRMIDVQDEERRDIARDLHDEIGPFLFTIRAGVGALKRKAAAPGAEAAVLAADCARIDAQIAALQQVNRRILGRLRPAALAEMGLAGALEALAQGWRETNPDAAIELDLSGAEGALDEAIALTAYRIVQEGLTNVFRHAEASRVEVRVARVDDGGRPALRIEVRDDGRGLAPGARQGLVLRGMSERVGALGGRLTLENAAEGGAALTAVVRGEQLHRGNSSP